MSTFKIKHDDNKVIISLDHMYVKDRYTILMFTLRVGKTVFLYGLKSFIIMLVKLILTLFLKMLLKLVTI